MFFHMNSKIPQLFETAIDKTLDFLYETPKESLAYATGAFALQMLHPQIAPPFWGAVVGALGTRLVIHVIDLCNPKLLYSEKKGICQFHQSHPNLKTILLIAALVVTIFSLIAGYVLGIALGIYCGLTHSIQSNVEPKKQTNTPLDQPITAR